MTDAKLLTPRTTWPGYPARCDVCGHIQTDGECFVAVFRTWMSYCGHCYSGRKRPSWDWLKTLVARQIVRWWTWLVDRVVMAFGWLMLVGFKAAWYPRQHQLEPGVTSETGVTVMVVEKPLMRYFGGKWLSAPKIIPHLPPHRIYVEPFSGAASVLMRKDRSFSEVINDLDGEIVNLFRILRHEHIANELQRRLQLTPYARQEFEEAYGHTEDRIERARRLLVRSWMGYSTIAYHNNTGFRTNVKYQRRSAPAGDWKRLINHIPKFVERLQGVAVENRNAIEVIRGHDTDDALFYVDPPYPQETRREGTYKFEMTTDDHVVLSQCLRFVKGMVVISGYACELYDQELYPDWTRVEFDALADGARPRTEVLWLNEAAKLALDQGWKQEVMF